MTSGTLGNDCSLLGYAIRVLWAAPGQCSGPCGFASQKASVVEKYTMLTQIAYIGFTEYFCQPHIYLCY
eukprot:4432200-Amphidinium_carterae.1